MLPTWPTDTLPKGENEANCDSAAKKILGGLDIAGGQIIIACLQ